MIKKLERKKGNIRMGNIRRIWKNKMKFKDEIGEKVDIKKGKNIEKEIVYGVD